MQLTYLEILQLLVDESDQHAVAADLETSQPQISRWLHGQEPKGPAIERIKALGEKRGLIGQKPDRDISSTDEGGQKGDVPSVDLRAGMGGGGLIKFTVKEDGTPLYPDQIDGYWSFPESVKSAFRRIPNAYAIPVIGDSMEPTIASGSFVFVDTTHTFPQPEDIYACSYDEGLVVKRLKLIPKSEKIMVISDNPIYGSDELLRKDVHVHGRVIAWFQWRK